MTGLQAREVRADNDIGPPVPTAELVGLSYGDMDIVAQDTGSRWGPSMLGQALAAERVRFLLVGAFNTAFSYTLFAVLFLTMADRVHYLFLLAGGHAVSTVLAFLLHRRAVFGDSGPALATFGRYLLVNAGMLALNAVFLPLAVHLSPAGPLVAQVLFVLLVVVVSYAGHKHFSFRRAPATVVPAKLSDGR